MYIASVLVKFGRLRETLLVDGDDSSNRANANDPDLYTVLDEDYCSVPGVPIGEPVGNGSNRSGDLSIIPWRRRPGTAAVN